MRSALLPAILVMSMALVACDGRAGRAREEPVGGQPTATTPATTAAPATTPAIQPRVATEAAPTGPMPAPGAISFAGFGPARFGATAEQVRMAWGKDMVGGPGDPDGCYYLYPEPRDASGYRIGFMVENQKFSRLDVDAAGIAAPGGGAVGMSVEEIRKRYADLVEQPHKYVEGGRYLRYMDKASGSVLVFETDASGKVTEWRLGVPPQVDYVEGCG